MEASPEPFAFWNLERTGSAVAIDRPNSPV